MVTSIRIFYITMAHAKLSFTTAFHSDAIIGYRRVEKNHRRNTSESRFVEML